MVNVKLIEGPAGVVGVLQGTDLFAPLPLVLVGGAAAVHSSSFNGCGFRTAMVYVSLSAASLGAAPTCVLRVVDPVSGAPLLANEDAVATWVNPVAPSVHSAPFDPTGLALSSGATFTPGLNVLFLAEPGAGESVTLDNLWLFFVR